MKGTLYPSINSHHHNHNEAIVEAAAVSEVDVVGERGEESIVTDDDDEADNDYEETLINRDNEESLDENTRKKKFMFRLVLALHGAGNMSYKTEEYTRHVAHTFGLHCSCSIFPTAVMLSFHDSLQLSPHSSESYTLRLSPGWHYHRLSLLDQLVYQITKTHLPFHSAEDALERIDTETKVYPWYVMLSANGIVAFAATTLFFGGTWTDGLWAFIFGLIVYGMGFLCEIYPGLSEIECFLSSFILAVISSLLDKFVYNNSLCQFGQLFGGIVWLLPGITITIAMLEIFSRMIVYGSSRLIYGISLALQLGFGLTAGVKLVFGDNYEMKSFEDGCRAPLSPYFGFFLLPLASAALGVIIQSNISQLPGMILTAGVGQIVSYMLTVKSKVIGSQAVPLMSAIMVTLAGRLYAYTRNERPMVYIIAGLLILVPGGVGVRGMSQMWSGDTQDGLEFTFRMLMIGISLAIGVFVALVPRKAWFTRSRGRRGWNGRRVSTAVGSRTNSRANSSNNANNPLLKKLLLASTTGNDNDNVVGSTANADVEAQSDDASESLLSRESASSISSRGVAMRNNK